MFFWLLFHAQSQKIYPTVSIINHSYWNQYRICFPPFNWSIPNGINQKQLPLFWAQPENSRHFRDTNSSEHCGIVRIVKNGSIKLPFPSISNVTHFINTNHPPSHSKTQRFNNLLILSGHWGHYFQHFFDNIGPQFGLVSVLDNIINISNTTVIGDTSPLFPNVPKLWNRMNIKKFISSQDKTYTAHNLIYVESCPRVHPYFFSVLRDQLLLQISKPKYIIFISRKNTNSYYNQRFILNQNSIINTLKSLYGNRVFVFDHKQHTLSETIAIFGKAIAIIGAHGGGMYNQFFAPKSCVIVEIMPIKENGLYPDQNSFKDVPSFSHMSVWSNSLLIGQKFYRFYQVTKYPNFRVDVQKFKRFLIDIEEITPNNYPNFEL